MPLEVSGALKVRVTTIVAALVLIQILLMLATYLGCVEREPDSSPGLRNATV